MPRQLAYPPPQPTQVDLQHRHTVSEFDQLCVVSGLFRGPDILSRVIDEERERQDILKAQLPTISGANWG